MLRKERVKKALQHKQTDVVPYNISFTIPAYQKLVKYYSDEKISDKIGNHLVRISAVSSDAWQEISPDIWQDEFKVVWNRTVDKDIGTVEGYVFPEPELYGYKFPEPNLKTRYAKFEEIANSKPDGFIIGGIGFSLFERAWTLRGMENILIDMKLNPNFVEELLDRILEYNLAVIEGMSKYKIDACHFGDDWGSQHGLIMGPSMWRKFIKPRIAKMYRKVHEKGLAVSIHSCGDIKEVIPDLIDIGLNIMNPFQPEVMDVYEMKQKYGKNLCFWGGVSTQSTLPYKTPDDVKKEVKQLLSEIGKDGGYILAPAHDIPSDVPTENMLALIEVVQNQ
ncbi:MAG: uroporphyrinogen decarboxylase family protein [Candidatus Firestonebacteria bacterium]